MARVSRRTDDLSLGYKHHLVCDGVNWNHWLLLFQTRSHPSLERIGEQRGLMTEHREKGDKSNY
jgi:hypothetical protein